MLRRDSRFWTRARGARDRLVDRFIHHPDVSNIDIGYAAQGDSIAEEIVLRIHVRERWTKARPGERVAFPKEVDGFPVIVMSGDYQLDADAPGLDEDR